MKLDARIWIDVLGNVRTDGEDRVPGCLPKAIIEKGQMIEARLEIGAPCRGWEDGEARAIDSRVNGDCGDLPRPSG